MKWIKSITVSLLIVGVSLIVLSEIQASGVSYKDVTVSAVGKDALGAVIVTEELSESWNYNGAKVVNYGDPSYILTKAWWLAWGYYDGVHTGVKVKNPNKEYMAYGSAHYHAGIPTPWGTIGINQDLYINLYFYYNGVYWSESGYGYET